MKHDFYERNDSLQNCRVCGGAEVTLPAECPGRRMTKCESDSVGRGLMDFRGERWWVSVPPEVAEARAKFILHLCVLSPEAEQEFNRIRDYVARGVYKARDDGFADLSFLVSVLDAEAKAK